jgi:mannose-6-phosphate isomerase-like protein (cupin superfamily)
VGRHRQQELPEVVITVEGTGEAGVNGVAVPMTPGAVVHLPLGAVLSITNLSTAAPLRYLIVKAGLPHGQGVVATPGTGG